MLIVSLLLSNCRAFLGVILAVWIAVVPNSETVLSSVLVVAFIDTARCWHSQKDNNFLASLLPVPIIIVVSTLAFAGIAIIFGAPLLSDTENTLLLGSLLSVLVVYPTALTSGGSITKIADTLVDFVADAEQHQQELGGAAGALAGAWLGAFVIPLDWDRPWQVWPVPCCVGAQLGSAAGRLLSRLRPTAVSHKLE